MKKVTINDIAKITGLSKTTISFYINEKYDKMSLETRKKIESAIQATGFAPSHIARRLNNKQTKLIGVIIGNITNALANQMLKGIDDCAGHHGYQLMIGNSDFLPMCEEGYLKSFSGLGVDGLIVQPSFAYNEVVKKINFKHPNIVFIDSLKSDYDGNWIKSNHYEAVLDALDYCMTCGYDHYVYVTEDPSIITTRMERYRGFIDEVSLKEKSHEIIFLEKCKNLNKALKNILKKHHKTLVFASSHLVLQLVYEALKEHLDLIPNQLGIIGFDSLEWTNLVTPSISSIVQPTYEEGYKACAMLIAQIENKALELPNVILKCTLNIKESTQ